METTDRIKTAKDNIVLIGMPAVGKSTLGVLLAKRINYTFIDTDLLIQTGEGESLKAIIQNQGIETFCNLEAKYVQGLSPRQTVIATGGSAVYRKDAMDHLAQLGTVVFLDIELAQLNQRLKHLDTRGVVRTSGQTVESLYTERRPLYQHHAQITVDCTNCTPEHTLQKILAALK